MPKVRLHFQKRTRSYGLRVFYYPNNAINIFHYILFLFWFFILPLWGQVVMMDNLRLISRVLLKMRVRSY